MGRYIPGVGFVDGFTSGAPPGVGFTRGKKLLANFDGRSVVGLGYIESSSEYIIVGSGYSEVAINPIIYAIRSDAAWNTMTPEEQGNYSGYFNTLSEWSDNLPENLIILNEQWIAECYNDWPAGLDDIIDISTKESIPITDANRNIILKTPITERHTGTMDTGFKLISTKNNSSILASTVAHIEIDGIVIENTSTSGIAISIPTFSKVKNSIIKSGGDALVLDDYCTAENSIVIAGLNAISVAQQAYSTNIYNCTIASAITGIAGEALSGELKVINNVLYNNITDFNITGSFNIDSSNNATSHATIDPALGTLVNISAADFIDAPLEDFSLIFGSKLIDEGKDLSLYYTTDIIGGERG